MRANFIIVVAFLLQLSCFGLRYEITASEGNNNFYADDMLITRFSDINPICSNVEPEYQTSMNENPGNRILGKIIVDYPLRNVHSHLNVFWGSDLYPFFEIKTSTLQISEYIKPIRRKEKQSMTQVFDQGTLSVFSDFEFFEINLICMRIHT
ncbi:MAG: hypothetical protein KKA84_02880 [Bacteroidetes bacterium]|nr:hypothetical protein [Bacteroidota bacterium]